MKLRNPMVLRALTRPGPSQLISVANLADESDLSTGFIYHLMNGRKEATPEVAGRITEVVAHHIDADLFVGEVMNDES